MATKVIAKRNTGAYHVELLDENGEYSLKIRYTGKWGGGLPVTVWIRTPDDVTHRAMQKWFKQDVVGDFDVAELLAIGGYDKYTVGEAGRGEMVNLTNRL